MIEDSKELYKYLKYLTRKIAIKSEGKASLMVALLYYLSKFEDNNKPVKNNRASVVMTDAVLQRELGISKYDVKKYRKELHEMGILDYQYRAAQPTQYWLNLDVLRTEYGYDCFDSNYNDVPSAPKGKVADATENNNSKYSKNSNNKKQTLDNSKNNISFSNSSYIFKKPYENVQEKRDKLLEDIKNN